jgi:hypothetical protein
MPDNIRMAACISVFEVGHGIDVVQRIEHEARA